MKSLRLLILNLLFCGLAISAHLPKSFKTCHRQDANFNECLNEDIMDSLQYLTEPIPSVGMTTFDPYVVEKFSVSAGSGGRVKFDQNYKNMKIMGLTGSKLKTSIMDFDKKQLMITGTVPLVELNGDYDFNGQLLVLPIKGNGKFKYQFENVDATIEINFEETEKKDKKYYNVTNVKVTFKMHNAHLNLDNLFDGNKELGDNINKVLNENWREILEDVQSGYEELIATVIKAEAAPLFSHVPIDEIFPN